MALDDPKQNGTSALIGALQDILCTLSNNPFPHVENPASCKKRASVALLIRIRPHFDYPAPSTSNSTSYISPHNENPDVQIADFFAQPWVQHGDPEVVFIKRAAREGDRWTSHVALPGGKRDPEDEDDRATAIRETREEIGIDLASDDVIHAGGLPQRIVSTSWGKVPLMVLCPFVFLSTRPDSLPINLQPAEVASSHWVPLRILLSPSVRSYEYVDVSDRFARQGGILVKAGVRSVLGRMRFSAIKLVPSESLYCSSTSEFFQNEPTRTNGSLMMRLYKLYLGDHAGSLERTRPLLLWGLTLGILADFLDQLPPYNAVKLWSYPTFTSWDARFIIHILTHNLRRRNESRLLVNSQTAADSETLAIARGGDNPWFIGGLSAGMKSGRRIEKNQSKEYAVGVMLEGYYDMARKGVWLTFFTRIVSSAALLMLVIRRYNRKS